MKYLKTILLSACLWAPISASAQSTVSIMDTAAPPQLNGDLTGWPKTPAIVLDKKTQVVLGQSDWTGPDVLSGKIYMTYDKTNLYIAADIKSKTPQYNSQNASNIYNGDALELYIGTDNSNPARKSYASTDVQVIISPGKAGDGAEIYSMTDKADIPGAKVATSATTGGYILEASIPLQYFYKINVGPGKSIGFDFDLDDCGPMGKARSLQMSFSGSSTSWQDPSTWGTLQFGGKTVYVNTSPKMAMPGAFVAEMDPLGGKKKASMDGDLIWGFNGGDLGGFTGKVSSETVTLTEGTGAMRIDTDGSEGWNQNLAVCSTVPLADKWVDFKAITMDIYFPAGSLAKAGYGEVYLVTQSPANNWEQIKMSVHEGWNHIKQDVDGTQFKGGVTKVYLVFNSGGPITGSVVIDNIRGLEKGASTQVTGKVLDAKGRPVPGAIVALAKHLLTAGSDGSFSADIPADDYVGEVFAPGFKSDKEAVTVLAGKPMTWNVTLAADSYQVKPAKADIFFNDKIRTFNPHYMYGVNIAAWYDPKWMTDPVALKRTEAISNYFRIPGGAYGNVFNWRTGQVYANDGTSVQWTPDFNWPKMAEFVQSVPNSEVLLIANIMTGSVQDALDWIADIKAKGIKLKYVELGNEPDYAADLAYKGQTQYWSVIDNYCKHYLEFAKAIRAKYPDLKLMGPTPAQVENRERKAGEPWLAAADSPWWVERFLEECGPYVDVVSVHSYPYWSNDSDSNLLAKVDWWAQWIPKIRAAIKKNIPDRYKKIEIAVTEWNSGDEKPATAELVNGLFVADYLAQMMVLGVNQDNIWDLFTQKPGLGGGHGLMDPNNNPDHPFQRRAHYWALYMMEHYFGTTLFQAVCKNDDLDIYASTGHGHKYLMVINKSKSTGYNTQVNLGEKLKGKHKLDFYQLSANEYQWSENLYRAVIDKGPTHLKASKLVENRFAYTFPPFSITCIEVSDAH
ncbi:MAG: sugar-binding protein [bacterium]